MEIIKGYCCHSKEVCSWPSFLSLLSKVNRLNGTARITKRGAFLAWISPPSKILVLPFRFPSVLNFQEWCLGRALLLKTLHLQLFVSLLFLMQWQQRWDFQHFQTPSMNQQLLALGHWNVRAHLAPRRVQGHWHREFLQGKGSLTTTCTSRDVSSPWMASQGPGSTAAPLSEAPEVLFNKPSPNCCNYLFTCLLTPLASPRMSSHLNTAHPSQHSSHEVLESKCFPKNASEVSPQVPNLCLTDKIHTIPTVQAGF